MIINDNIKLFVRQHANADVHKLLFTKHKELTDEELKLAIQQIDGRQRVKKKLPTWASNLDVVYPIHLSLEQCSSEETAQFKADLVSGNKMIDLTGGFGVDTFFLSKNFKEAIHIEQNAELSAISAHNFKALNRLNVLCLNMSAEEALREVDSLDLIYIDPARRDEYGGKIVSIADCTPNVMELQELFSSKTKQALIKLSPMLDITQAVRELTHVTDVYVVSMRNECKELLIKTDYSSQKVNNISIHCVNLLADNRRETFDFDMIQNNSQEIVYTAHIEEYLYEPNASVLKAGGFNSLALSFNFKKLHPNSHLFTSNECIENFPGRIIKVEGTYGFDKQSLKGLKTELKQANLIIRNFPSTPETLLKRLKIKEGGESYLYATTAYDNTKVLIRGLRYK